jgi:hypothetical protein
MASQDNPERGLCHHASAPRPVSEVSKPPKPKGVPVEVTMASGRPSDSRNRRKSAEIGQTSTIDKGDTKDASAEDKQSRRKTSMEDALSRRDWPDLTTLEEPTTIDHRSFVQNVFGTVAFKMLEWLTPRNLDLLANSGNTNVTEKEVQSVPDILMDDSKITKPTSAEAGNELVEAVETTVGHLKDMQNQQRSSIETTIEATSLPTNPTKPISDFPLEEKLPRVEKWMKNHPTSKRPSSLRKKTDPLDQVSKGLINKIQSEPSADIKPTLSSHVAPIPRRKMSRQTLITSPTMQMADTPPSLHELKFLPNNIIESVESPSSKDDESEASAGVKKTPNKPLVIPKGARSPKTSPTRQLSLPQSISYLTIQTIDLMCDIMQSNGTSEKHFLQPQDISEDLKRRRDKSFPLSRDRSLQKTFEYPSSAKHQWLSFIEQSFFDVLGRPESLLRSFSDEKNRLFDTQTIWYLMLRMTRVSPSLVFDTLWHLSGVLFKPPQKLEAAYEWAKELQSQEILSQKALSNHEAAQAINICLHALVAAAPLVSDARQLANMSRIRSYGLAMLGREASSLEPATLCLQYEDAFTNDLVLRLARRLFAAISTRRRFTELLDLQTDIRNDEKSQPDVLETILGTLKFLDLGTPPILYFPDDERDLHEKRVPTLILDWARTVMLQDWEGAAEVPSDGPFGGALATMAAICKFQ